MKTNSNITSMFVIFWDNDFATSISLATKMVVEYLKVYDDVEKDDVISLYNDILKSVITTTGNHGMYNEKHFKLTDVEIKISTEEDYEPCLNLAMANSHSVLVTAFNINNKHTECSVETYTS